MQPCYCLWHALRLTSVSWAPSELGVLLCDGSHVQDCGVECHVPCSGGQDAFATRCRGDWDPKIPRRVERDNANVSVRDWRPQSAVELAAMPHACHARRCPTRNQGVRGFYKGMAPHLYRGVLASAVTLVVYEKVVAVLRGYNESEDEVDDD